MLRKLRVKFVCINMLLVTALLLAALGLILRFTGQSLASASVRMMAEAAERPAQPGRPGEPPVRLPCFILELDRRGELTAVEGGFYDLTDEEFLRGLAGEALDTRQQTGALQAYGLRFYIAPTPEGVRIVFADRSSETEALGSLARSCAAVGCAAFLAFLVISLCLARWAVRPVEEAWTRQRQFVADASHELKTPLTVILTNAELLQDPAYGAPERDRFARNVLTMARQMRALVEHLLALARVDAGRAEPAPLDLSALVSDAALPFEPLFFESGLELVCRIEPGIRVKGSGERLRQVADALLDNALKYAAPAGPVEAVLRRQGRGCLFTVASSGDPIPEEELPRLFQRFYRGDRARPMDHSYGLGLAIAEGIVAEHGGRIWAESAGGRNTFLVYLPALRENRR